MIAGEIPLTIYANDKEVVTLLASPNDLKELAVGFLFTSGLIMNLQEVESITADSQNWTVYLRLKNGDIDERLLFKRMFTSGCGAGTLFYKTADLAYRKIRRRGITIDRNKIFRLMKEFQRSSPGFKQTGGIHSAALADREGILAVKEDIGRHNAVDKIMGWALMDNIDLKDKIILSSGRVSSEVLLKVQKTPISIIVSQSAPTDQAVKHAKDSSITLVGFVRGQRMNVYSKRERII